MYHTYFNQTNNLIGFARVLSRANAQDNGWGFLGCNGTVSTTSFVALIRSCSTPP
jgi:hypothetical protein